ncbi:YihY/virulence factor BrkB family protein [Alicyclobacillaceae bacterium I2511]|nr:YihY/virulence factor BrkB family protein [Alicyclobacillaceae bacterium I2511]
MYLNHLWISLNTLWAGVKSFIQFVLQRNIAMLASVLAFFAFSSMIPLLLLIIYVASFLIPAAPLKEFMDQLLQSYMPTFPTSPDAQAINVARLATVGSQVGVIGVLGVLWTTVGGFVSLQQTFDIIANTSNRRSFIIQYLVGFAMLGLLLLLTISATVLTMISPDFVNRVLGFQEHVQLGFLTHEFSLLTFALLLFFTCYFSYRFLTSSPLPPRSAFLGALLATAGIYLSRLAFVLYTAHLGRYVLVYGTLTFITLLAFWIYIVSIILLLGMAVAVKIRPYRPT